MKKYMMLNILGSMIILMSPQIFGGTIEADAVPQPSCMNLAAACEAAGIGQNRHQVWRNCVKPIVEGRKSFRRLNISPEDIQSCRDRIQMHKPYYWRKGANQQSLGS